jgi:hypothetical protein
VIVKLAQEESIVQLQVSQLQLVFALLVSIAQRMQFYPILLYLMAFMGHVQLVNIA